MKNDWSIVAKNPKAKADRNVLDAIFPSRNYPSLLAVHLFYISVLRNSTHLLPNQLDPNSHLLPSVKHANYLN